MNNYKMKGVDISHWNGNVDFKILKEAGAEFVMIKLAGEEKESGTIRMHSITRTYYKKAKEAGLHVGTYFYMSDKKNAILNSPKKICELIDYTIRKNGFEFDMPISIDVEGKKETTKEETTAYVKEWCEIMESLGYYVSIYGSDIGTFKDLLVLEDLVAFDKWVARYDKEPEYVKTYGMWQNHNNSRFYGHSGVFDTDISYINYPDLIKRSGLNHYKKEETDNDATGDIDTCESGVHCPADSRIKCGKCDTAGKCICPGRHTGCPATDCSDTP